MEGIFADNPPRTTGFCLLNQLLIRSTSLECYQFAARLGEMELSVGGEENGGPREASVLRYKEKRRMRLFSKTIRYKVRKVNADRRPRIKGRFIRPSQQQ